MTNVLFECLGFGMRTSNNIVVNKHIAYLLFYDDQLSSSSKPPSSAIQKFVVPSPIFPLFIFTKLCSLKFCRQKPLWADAFAEGERDAVTHFNFLYCFLFLIFDEVWVEMKASYMDFPRVLEVFFFVFFS